MTGRRRATIPEVNADKGSYAPKPGACPVRIIGGITAPLRTSFHHTSVRHAARSMPAWFYSALLCSVSRDSQLVTPDCRIILFGKSRSFELESLNVVDQLTSPVIDRFVMEDQKIAKRGRKRPDRMRCRR